VQTCALPIYLVDARARQYIDAFALVLLGQFRRDFFIFERQDAVEEFDQRDLDAVTGVDVSELDANRPRPGDNDRLRQRVAHDLLLISDDPLAKLRSGQQARDAAGGDDAILEFQRLFAALVQLDAQGVGIDKRRPTVILVDFVLPHQEMYALDAALSHLTAALERDAVVE